MKLGQIVDNVFYKPLLKIYLKTDSNILFDGFKLKIFKGVFHPKLFFSTKYFYDFIKGLELKDLNFLEVGSGSGILSLLAYRKNAHVTALDVDPKAVENTKLNFARNALPGRSVIVIQSNVFDNLPVKYFDVIVINPPYYFKNVQVDEQLAWYCGENGEYFKKLFSGLHHFANDTTRVFMILEENCEIERIKSMASEYCIHFELIDQKKIRWERSFIFRLCSRVVSN